MKIKIVSALITVLISLSMCGCGLYKETDMQYTVSALGFDGINGITVYAEIITMNPQSDDITTGNCVLKASGENLISAFKELRHLVAKPLFLSHCGVICLGENLKKSQINDILDYCYDNDEINHTVYFINSSHTEELLNLKPESEISTGYNIMGIIRQSENSDCIHYNNIFYEIEAERTGAQDIFSVPEFEIENDTPVIKGVCVYSDCKRSAKLNLDESYYYYLLKGLSKSGNCVIGDKKVKISVPKTTFKCKADKNLKFDIKISLEYSESDNISDYVVKNCKRLIEKSIIEYKTDIFGFGDRIYKKYEHIWNMVQDDYNLYYLNSEATLQADFTKIKSNLH